ncbi:MAG: PD-(D/E)XK nuclease family protein [Anaerolineae bacterium]|nr:PD-(D/E)XK nuclease family protein [Anaerolineae bacterium]
MTLPETFHFTQGKLQDYVDCPRRFQLRHVLMQPWPALITGEPQRFELHMQRGAALHRLAHQHARGIDPARLAETIHDETLARWWHTFLRRPPRDLPEAVRHAEIVLAGPIGSHRLLAKYDLIAIQPGERLVIVDWKTVSKQPSRARLAGRLQTIVYRYLAVEAGAALNNGQSPAPDQVEMIYWFAQSQGQTERFAYDRAQHDGALAHLLDLTLQITAHTEPVWPLTADESRCRLCRYRSLCERGATAGFLNDLEDDIEPLEDIIDLEQIAEVEF